MMSYLWYFTIFILCNYVSSVERTMFDFASISPSRLTPFDIEAYTKAAVIRQNQENAFIAHMSTLAAARRASIARDPIKNGTKSGNNLQREDAQGIPELLQRFLIQREKDHLAQIQNVMLQGQNRGILGEGERFGANDRSDQMIERFLSQNRGNAAYQPDLFNSGTMNTFPVFNRGGFSKERAPVSMTSTDIDLTNQEETQNKRLSMPKIANDDFKNIATPLQSLSQSPFNNEDSTKEGISN
uniref:DUF148 domain-containing protein n=1 Tax=Parastrongyloides trichosuri TaxID=131310 RepID=A0A0N4ZG39_PARTI